MKINKSKIFLAIIIVNLMCNSYLFADLTDNNCLAPFSATRMNLDYLKYSELFKELKLDKYPEVAKKLFSESNKVVLESLINNNTLRPIFMVNLKDAHKVIINSKNKDILENYGGYEYLSNNKAMLFGDIRLTEEFLTNNKDFELRIGVSDKLYARSSNSNKQRMTHGRQAFFPQADGTWVGIKGAGFLRDTKAPRAAKDRYMGLVTTAEVEGADLEITEAAHKNLCPKFLGSVQVDNLPDTRGGFINFSDIRKEEDQGENSHLMYYHALTPYRLSDLTKLAETDKDLSNTRLQIAKAIKSTDEKYKNIDLESIFPDNVSLFKYIFNKVGRYQALKTNNNVKKFSLHKQDISLAGEEADTEELEPLDEPKSQQTYFHKSLMQILIQPKLNGFINDLEMADLLKSLVRGYFAEADLELLSGWKDEFDANPTELIKKVVSVEEDGSIYVGFSMNDMYSLLQDQISSNLNQVTSASGSLISTSH